MSKWIASAMLLATTLFTSNAFAGISIPPSRSMEIQCNHPSVTIQVSAYPGAGTALMRLYTSRRNYSTTVDGTLDAYGRGTLFISPIDSFTFYRNSYGNLLFSANLDGSRFSGYCTLRN